MNDGRKEIKKPQRKKQRKKERKKKEGKRGHENEENRMKKGINGRLMYTFTEFQLCKSGDFLELNTQRYLLVTSLRL